MYTPNRSISIASLVIILIGILSGIFAFITDSHAAWTNLLFNNYFFLGISLFAVFFVALQYVSEAGWSIVLKRVPEAIMTFLPYVSAIMLFIVITAVLHFGNSVLRMSILKPIEIHFRASQRARDRSPDQQQPR